MAVKTIESKGYDNGYNDAIETIKKMLAGGQNGSGGGGMIPDPNLQQPDINQNGQGNNSNSNSGSSSGQNSSKGNSSSGGGSNRDADSSGKTGIVRPEDCEPLGNVDGVPNEPGAMIDSQSADKIAKEEGYDSLGGSDGSTEKEWGEKAIKAASKLKGDQAGGLKSKIEGIYKVSHDWKKELRKIVGMSLSPEDRRQAYAHKNTLISQDRITRTDKDKYDNMDYMMAWIDSSGSMSDDMLKKCLSEIYYVALAKKPIKLVIIQCDTKIQEIKEYTNLRDLQKDMIHASVKGRGGTELKPCWDLLKTDQKYKRRPCELVMVFTDGYLTQYKRDPRSMKNLCWVIIDNPGFNVENKDMHTKCVHLKSSDIK